MAGFTSEQNGRLYQRTKWLALQASQMTGFTSEPNGRLYKRTKWPALSANQMAGFTNEQNGRLYKQKIANIFENYSNFVAHAVVRILQQERIRLRFIIGY
jgi:hypothetical protein